MELPASAAAAYVDRLINAPWTRDGRHCWRLVADVQRDLFGRALPPVLDAGCGGGEGRRYRRGLFAQHAERGRWHEVGRPVHGAVALMRRRAAVEGDYEHAGVWLELDGGGVLHTDAPHGVVLDSLRDLGARGWVPSWFVPGVS
ncbi:hypothetical protein A33M_1698 [Rhodovulum sp. PH10]|uniref:hypothetical protein n=1 Tax=Rhodovulum sp. PH10 TaxID=1187851 RepID=UPI00027C24A6|nr:hypothetical protein [Rhodovulum sp. PH10]EJW12728.1 hypothetical protein A33M_1698 [Rhodovulum sp. PH10]